MKGNSGAHKNFTQEMCKKTVINRACKTPINSSSDAILIGGENSDNTPDSTIEDVKQNIQSQTAVEEVSFEEIKTHLDVIKESEKMQEKENAIQANESFEFDIETK
jgi:recombination protein RecT